MICLKVEKRQIVINSNYDKLFKIVANNDWYLYE